MSGKRYYRPLIIGAVCAALALSTHSITSSADLPDSSARHLTIIYSTDTSGSLEPCGCGGLNAGGIVKRVTAVKDIVSRDPQGNYILVESGNVGNMASSEQAYRQLKLVAGLLNSLNYTAVGLGLTDIGYGESFYKMMEEAKLPVVNIDGKKHTWAQPYIIKEVDGVKVGIVSFGATVATGDQRARILKQEYAAFRAARKHSDILILLDQAKVATDDWLRENAASLGSPDILVGGAGRWLMTTPKMIGRTMIVPTSTRGTWLGWVDVTINGADKQMKTGFRLLNETVKDDPEAYDLVQNFYAEERRQMQLEAFQTNVSKTKLNGPPYVVHQMCVKCHPDEYKQWRNTKHATALNTLVQKDRIVAECMPCHSQAYKSTGGVITDPNLMLGVECASCHASVLPHGEDGPAASATRKVDPKVCLTCHTPERSQNYNEKTYWPRIIHAATKS